VSWLIVEETTHVPSQSELVTLCLIRIMAFLDYQPWLLLETLILAILLTGRFGIRRAAEHPGRPLEVLYETKGSPDADKNVPPSGRKNNHTVECVLLLNTLSR